MHKILFIIDSLEAGGTQRQLLYLIKNLDKRVFSVVVCNLGLHDEFFVNEYKKINVPLITIPQSGRFKIDLACFFRLTRLILSVKPVLVETLLFTADCYGRIASKLSNVPLIVSSQRNVDPRAEKRHLFLDRILAKYTTRFIANSLAVRVFLTKECAVGPDRIALIHNGVLLRDAVDETTLSEMRRELGIRDDEHIVGMVARFVPQKDHRLFIEIAKKMLEKRRDTHFLLVGDGRLKPEIEDLVRRSRLEKNIHFLGLVNDAHRYISLMDISVLTSLYEGCSNVILESMAAGRPVVATNVGGNVELVEDGKTGFLVGVKDREAFAEKLLYLIMNPQVARVMGEAGRNKIRESFSIEEMVRKTTLVFQELIGAEAKSSLQ